MLFLRRPPQGFDIVPAEMQTSKLAGPATQNITHSGMILMWVLQSSSRQHN